MKIIIQLGESIKSRHNDKVLLPQIKVASTTHIRVFGLYDDKMHLLELKREENAFTAGFFLHENITAHIHTDKFNLFITNTRNFIGCLATNETTAFAITKELTYSQEREVMLSDTLVHEFFIIEGDDETFTIEPLFEDDGKDTEKIGSI